MPSRTKRVRFETEYNSSFKAFDPEIYKSPLISALIDEPKSCDLDRTKQPAGLKSNKFLKSVEPPLQSKSKLDHCHEKKSESVLNSENQNVEDVKNESGSGEIVKNKPVKNRALEYKAGLKSDNSLAKNKYPVSEYQREYEQNKFAIADSPLLNAEKIVFDSHTNIPRFVRDKVPRKTEYQSKFAETRGVARKEKKRNKDEHEDSEDNPPSAVKRLLRTSHNPDPPFFPHGSSNRVIHTEYQANFGSPKKYQYEEGIWLGAKPPHLLPDDQSVADSNEHITNWFEEVLELREKARHYKLRAIEGNYFSREYLAQLDAELEQLYEEQSENAKNKGKSGHSDEGSRSHSVPRRRDKGRHSTEKLGRPRVKHAWGSDESSKNIEDGKNIYRDLNEQFKDVSPCNETCSSFSEDHSVHSNYEGNTDKDLTRPSPAKTVDHKHSPHLLGHDKVTDKNNNLTISKKVNQKHSPTFHATEKHARPTTKRDGLSIQDVSRSDSEDSSLDSQPRKKKETNLSKTVNPKLSPTFHETTKPKQIVKGDRALLSDLSSGSEASSELSVEHRTESDARDEYESPDKFNIKYVQGMHSNDYEAPSTSVRSNFGSESLGKSGYSSDLSQSSLASRESVARNTLARAKQRKENFW